MKSILLLAILFLLSIQSYAQDNKEFLIAPDDWRKEQLQLPLSFAPELDYNGLEDVRFAKGWGDQESEEFWTYRFAWYLDKNPALNTEKLNKEIQLYFDGLMNIIAKGRKISKEKVIATKATFSKKTKNSFIGKATVFDAFFTQKTIDLNIKVDYEYCPATKKHIAYFGLSPQSFQHKLWSVIDNILIPCD